MLKNEQKGKLLDEIYIIFQDYKENCISSQPDEQKKLNKTWKQLKKEINYTPAVLVYPKKV